MADYSKTFSYTLNVSGGGPTEKWNELVYGTDVWLGPEDLRLSFEKWLASSTNLSSALDKALNKGLPIPVNVAVSLNKELVKWLANTVTSSEAMTKELTKWLTLGVTLTEALDKVFTKFFGNSITATTDNTSIVQRGIWSLLYPGATTNALERSIPDYDEQISDDPTWNSQVASTTIWS